MDYGCSLLYSYKITEDRYSKMMKLIELAMGVDYTIIETKNTYSFMCSFPLSISLMVIYGSSNTSAIFSIATMCYDVVSFYCFRQIILTLKEGFEVLHDKINGPFVINKVFWDSKYVNEILLCKANAYPNMNDVQIRKENFRYNL